jgi:hypothetical protein
MSTSGWRGDSMRRVTLGALSLVALAPAVAAQQAIDAFEVPGWNGAAYLDPGKGSFSHCTVSSVFGGVTLSFILDKTEDFRIEIGADDWRLKSGGDYVTTLVIDSHEPLQTIASARSDKRLAIEIGPDDDIVKALREGLFLRVLAEHVGLSFSLSGSSQALLQLRGCVNEHRGAPNANR